MPKNPHKTPCRVPGCQAWAMRGHTLCRSHRDTELCSRGAGAPSGNLNTLKSGHYARPVPLAEIQELAHQIRGQPDQLPQLLGDFIASLHARSQDPVRILLAFSAVLAPLQSQLADDRFLAEFDAFLRRLPPEKRDEAETAFLLEKLPLEPEARLVTLRHVVRNLEESGHLPRL